MSAESTNILYLVVAIVVCAGFLFCWTRRGNDGPPTPEQVRDEFNRIRESQRESERQANNAEQSAKELQREIDEGRIEITTVADGIDDVKSDIIRGAIIARESRELVKQIRERLSKETKQD